MNDDLGNWEPDPNGLSEADAMLLFPGYKPIQRPAAPEQPEPRKTKGKGKGKGKKKAAEKPEPGLAAVSVGAPGAAKAATRDEFAPTAEDEWDSAVKGAWREGLDAIDEFDWSGAGASAGTAGKDDDLRVEEQPRAAAQQAALGVDQAMDDAPAGSSAVEAEDGAMDEMDHPTFQTPATAAEEQVEMMDIDEEFSGKTQEAATTLEAPMEGLLVSTSSNIAVADVGKQPTSSANKSFGVDMREQLVDITPARTPNPASAGPDSQKSSTQRTQHTNSDILEVGRDDHLYPSKFGPSSKAVAKKDNDEASEPLIPAKRVTLSDPRKDAAAKKAKTLISDSRKKTGKKAEEEDYEADYDTDKPAASNASKTKGLASSLRRPSRTNASTLSAPVPASKDSPTRNKYGFVSKPRKSRAKAALDTDVEDAEANPRVPAGKKHAKGKTRASKVKDEEDEEEEAGDSADAVPQLVSRRTTRAALAQEEENRRMQEREDTIARRLRSRD